MLQERGVWTQSWALIDPFRGVISVFPLKSHHICSSLVAYTDYAVDGRAVKDLDAFTRYGDIGCKGAWSDEGLNGSRKVEGSSGAAHETCCFLLVGYRKTMVSPSRGRQLLS